MGVDEKEAIAMAIAAAINEDIAVYEAEYREWCTRLAQGELKIDEEVKDACSFNEAWGCIKELEEAGKPELARRLREKLERIAPRVARRCDKLFGYDDAECEQELWCCMHEEILRRSKNPEIIRRNVKECEEAHRVEIPEGYYENEMWMFEWGEI